MPWYFSSGKGVSGREGAGGAAVITGLVLDVADLDESHPQLGHNESYSLVVPDTGGDATLQAPNIYAALHGLETFSQSVYIDASSSQYLIDETSITDAPRFHHRGIMIDTARHFYDVNVILEHLDVMAYNKFNGAGGARFEESGSATTGSKIDWRTS